MKWQEWEEEMRAKRSQADPLKELETTVHQDIMSEGLRAVGRLQAGEAVPAREFHVPPYASVVASLRKVAARLKSQGVQWVIVLDGFGGNEAGECWLCTAKDEQYNIGMGEAPLFGVAVLLAAIEFARMRERAGVDRFLEDVFAEEGE